MSSDSAVIESNSAFSLSRLTPTNQTLAMPPTHQVDTSGVRWRGEMWPRRRGNACRRAMDSPVRDAGRIVVCVEAMAAVATARRTTQSQSPITSVESRANIVSSSSARSEEHTSELQSRQYLVCRLLLEKKNAPLFLLCPLFS